MKFIVLGAAAGGGLPQWNCGCPNCNDARAGRIAPLTQSSLAVSPDGAQWAILNASPDIRQQLGATPALHPDGLRSIGLRSVLLTNGDIDHVAGLLSLRERTAFDLFATRGILDILAQNRIFEAVSPEVVPRRPVALGAGFDLLPGLHAELVAVPGKVPLYLEGETVDTGQIGEQTVGVRLSAGGRSAWYIPGCAEVTDAVLDMLAPADLVFFDGTVWHDDEMIRSGTGHKTGRRMGHVPIAGADGSLSRMAGLAGRRVYVHINNTNPILQPDSPEHAAVLAAGWQIAADGQEFAI
ncbi:MAG: pyrroloquinoline quinone biosynthesis protein PqqB [Rhodobacteraceae bacterium]|nr:pyrroloquinoline quinone biosynthesis protein PqqB [Paracoccaceae bacterium]